MNNRKNRCHSFRPLNDEGINKIHQSSMEVLGEVGFEIHNDEAFELFRRRNVRADSAQRRVWISEAEVRNILSTAKPDILLCGRDEKHDLHLGSGNVYFGTGGTALNVLDYETGARRQATLQDLIDIIRIVEELDNVHLMLLPTYPNEIPVDAVDVNRFLAGFTYSSKHVMGGVYTSQGIRDVIAMAEYIAGSPEALRERPFLSMITCGISPLRLDKKYGGYMIQVARAGIPVAVPAEPLCGATSPITLAGNLVIQNCDALINVMLTQLANPGAPVIYGCVASSTDLRNLAYIGGSVESGLVNAAAAQLAQYYGIPYYATAGISDSKTLDAQCGYESAINNLMVALAGADFIHDAAGLMEFALTVSKEKLVIDNDILGMTARAVRGIDLSDDALALDQIREVGPGGNFISARHTRRFMHREHYRPYLSDRDQRDVWVNEGQQDTAERAHEMVARILSTNEEYHITPLAAREIASRFPAVTHTNCYEGILV